MSRNATDDLFCVHQNEDFIRKYMRTDLSYLIAIKCLNRTCYRLARIMPFGAAGGIFMSHLSVQADRFLCACSEWLFLNPYVLYNIKTFRLKGFL